MTSDNAMIIAGFMADATKFILWDKFYTDHPIFQKYNFSIRTGSGRSTYCRFLEKNKDIVITYGRKMIQDKMNHECARQWLSFRELEKFKYYSQPVNYINLLSHTVLHEFSHVLQYINSQTGKGSIHNKYFYNHLDSLYKDNYHVLINAYLKSHFLKHNISIDFERNQLHSRPTNIELLKNTSVKFRHKNRFINGTIIKVNKKTYLIERKTWLGNSVWRVPKPLVLKK